MTTPEEARREQLAYGRSTLRISSEHSRTERESRPRPSSGAPRAPAAMRGHDAILKAMQDNRQNATIITNDGEKFEGVITGRDKYTITLKTLHPTASRAGNGETVLRVFYKSAIEQFYGEQVPRSGEVSMPAVQ